MKKTNKKEKPIQLSKGDVIRTNPSDSFWGCAVVLDEKEKDNQFHAMCLIAILDTVFFHKYQFEELKLEKAEIVYFEKSYRIAPFQYSIGQKRPSIGIYPRKMKPNLDVIGNLEKFPFDLPPLSFNVGDGLNGRYPLCGPITNNLGYEAIITWRKKYDNEKFEIENNIARFEHEELLINLKKKRK
ncbi:hypothetical protein EHQ96_18370 [Leptospira levettii]|uniref:hypothetical protein n=1 Tax=Leptospira levettii TaxID=2023178 RepID=UPI0010835471|nr:hypothetical protein [Leptospira levettii]TGM62922.1 hypothetical protein EHQ96_18370 [Leptospira levettii]